LTGLTRFTGLWGKDFDRRNMKDLKKAGEGFARRAEERGRV
jgi:hypothetical protein